MGNVRNTNKINYIKEFNYKLINAINIMKNSHKIKVKRLKNSPYAIQEG